MDFSLQNEFRRSGYPYSGQPSAVGESACGMLSRELPEPSAREHSDIRVDAPHNGITAGVRIQPGRLAIHALSLGRRSPHTRDKIQYGQPLIIRDLPRAASSPEPAADVRAAAYCRHQRRDPGSQQLTIIASYVFFRGTKPCDHAGSVGLQSKLFLSQVGPFL